MRPTLLLRIALGASALSVSSAPQSVASQAAAPAPAAPITPSSEAFDREVRAARSYLEGWFGAAIRMPPIEIVSDETGAPADLPGHYQAGVVRLRAATLAKVSELRRVLRHELTHATIDQRARGNCPHWLQEGIAQFLDGTDVVATDAWLSQRTADLIPLFRLEGPFHERDQASRELAYRESASAVSFLVGRIGRSGLLFLVARLGEGRPFDRALIETGLSYAELQQAWMASLRPRVSTGKTAPRSQGAAIR